MKGEQNHPVLWIIALVAAIIASIVATVVRNVITGEANRPHNTVLLINECLAETHSAYLVFFIALTTGSAFNRYWGGPVIPVVILVALVFYIKGIHITTKDSHKIVRDHPCATGCERGIGGLTVLAMLSANAIFAIILFASACYLVSITTQSPPCGM